MRVAHGRGELLQPLRPARPQRAARPRRRLRPPAILHPPRRPARDPAPRGAGAAGRGAHPARPPPPRRRAGRGGRHPPLRRRRGRRAAPPPMQRRRRRRLRRHPLRPAPATPPGGGRAEIHRLQHVARRLALAADPDRRHHGPRRLARHRQDGALPHPQRDRRRGPPAPQLGLRDRERRPTAAAATGTCPAASADVLPHVAEWRFPWLDVPAMLRASQTGAGIPDGGPGPAAALDLRPPDPARRRRAPDGAARLQRRRPIHPRRPLPRRRAGAHRRTTPPRRCRLRGGAPAGHDEGGAGQPHATRRTRSSAWCTSAPATSPSPASRT